MSKPILVGYDGSPESVAAIDWAVTAAVQRGLPLTVLSVWTTPALDFNGAASGQSVAMAEELEGVLRTEQAAIVERHGAENTELRITGVVEAGRPAALLVSHAKDSSMVVVGSHGRDGLSGMLLGSVSRQVATHAKCPVVVVRSATDPQASGMVVGVDGSEHSLRALEWAFEQASLSRATLHVLHTWEIPPTWSVAEAPSYEPEALIEQFGNTELRATAEAMAGFRDRFPDVDVRQEVMRGSAVKSLVAASEGAQMLVVGSRGHGGFVGLLLGSVSHAVAHRAHCSVAVIH